MKKSLLTFAVAAWAAIVASEARATTFPALTTIYFASGVVDNSTSGESIGIATLISCSNMSGQTASVRYIFRRDDGTVAGFATLSLAYLAAQFVATQDGVEFVDATAIPTSYLGGGRYRSSRPNQRFIAVRCWSTGKQQTGPKASRCTWCGSTRIPERWSSRF